MKKIYLDHAATTPLDPLVLEEMNPFFAEKCGNASSLHEWGREAREAVEKSREKTAKAIGCEPKEVVFTSGGSESDNLAIVGFAQANRGKGKHIITSAFEHPAVLDPCKFLEKNGFEVTYVPVSREGIVEVEALRKAIRKDTVLVSIMHANNEIGTVQPIEEIAEFTKQKNIAFHTDAVQTVGKVPVGVKKLGVDMLTVSAHKFYGPKGVGTMYVRKGIALEPLIHGGGQEMGRRSGTENVPGIVGMGKAIELAIGRMAEDSKGQERLRDALIKNTLEIEDSWLNGHEEKRLSNNAHFGFSFIEGESLVLKLDEKGVAASTGSACSSHSLEPSHVLLALGLSHVQAHGSLRMTLGRENTEKDIEYVAEVLPEVVKNLRKMSPLHKGMSLEFEKPK
jgi:cysteine desulfurase